MKIVYKFSKRFILILCATIIVFSQSVSAMTYGDITSIVNNTPFYDPACDSGGSTVSSGSLAGVDILDGHELPASEGYMGAEETVQSLGGPAALGLVPPPATKEEQKFYITMRWMAFKWAWNGENIWGPEAKDYDWYLKHPRIIVTNTRNNKSVVLAALESGPAPWTGAAGDSSNPPSYWQGYIAGTPAEYKGRVSGLPPDAYKAIDARQVVYNQPGSGDILTYQWAQDQSLTPGTTGEGGKATSPSSASGDISKCCPSSQSSNSSSENNKTVVVVDPGHSEQDITEIAPGTNLKTFNYSNGIEDQENFDVATKLKDKLTNAGYEVIMTKDKVNETVGHVSRAKIANDSKADIAVSIHTDSSQGSFGNWGWVTPQKVGGYRESFNGNEKLEFDLPDVAKKSQEYTKKIVAARKKNEPKVIEHDLNFDSRGGKILPGNLSWVQLLSKVPWVYNESGARLNANDKEDYAQGIFEGIKNSIGPDEHSSKSQTTTDQSGCSTGDGVVAGDIVQTALNLAWPFPKVESYSTDEESRKAAKPEYVKAFDKYNKVYGNTAYADCGKFVATVMLASGADSKYVHAGTSYQQSYLKDKKDMYEEIPNKGNTSNLLPGDIFIYNNGEGHTFLYVGKQKGGDAREASLGNATPNSPAGGVAGYQTFNYKGGPPYYIFRIKK